MRKDWCYQPAIHHPPGKYVPTWSYGDLGDYTLYQLPDQAFPREWQMEVGKWDHCQPAIIHLIQIFCRLELGNIGSTTGFSAHWDNFSTPWISVGVAAATNQNANACALITEFQRPHWINDFQCAVSHSSETMTNCLC